MIFTLRDLIPHSQAMTYSLTGQWVRAMHLPFYDGLIERFRNAWAVLKGPHCAVAVRWPKDGEFEQAMALSEKER